VIPLRLPQTRGVRGVTVSIRIPLALLDQLNVSAANAGLTRGRFIVDILEAHARGTCASAPPISRRRSEGKP